MRRGSSASYPVSCHRFQSLVTVAIERRRAPRLLRQGGQPNLKRESFLIRLTKHGGRASWMIAKRKVGSSTATQMGGSTASKIAGTNAHVRLTPATRTRLSLTS